MAVSYRALVGTPTDAAVDIGGGKRRALDVHGGMGLVLRLRLRLRLRPSVSTEGVP
jgi:hypothetical protein